MNQIPLLGGLFEIIGILFTMWFAFRHLLLATSRQEIAAEIGSMTADVFGKTTAIAIPEKQAIVLTNLVEPGIVEIPEIPKAELIAVEPKSETPAKKPVIPHSAFAGNGVDELRYLFITSEVELIESNAVMQELPYSFQSPELAIGVVKADGEKCDRCWNYSTHVGESIEHPLICERCVSALAGEF
jgi:isoleucyl-tRNA synthetase